MVAPSIQLSILPFTHDLDAEATGLEEKPYIELPSMTELPTFVMSEPGHSMRKFISAAWIQDLVSHDLVLMTVKWGLEYKQTSKLSAWPFGSSPSLPQQIRQGHLPINPPPLPPSITRDEQDNLFHLRQRLFPGGSLQRITLYYLKNEEHSDWDMQGTFNKRDLWAVRERK